MTDVPAQFSGDDKRLLFTSSRTGRREIYVMSDDGSKVARIKTDTISLHPAWSPDERQMVFTSYRGMSDSAIRAVVQPGNIFIANSDGSEPRQLTTDGVSSVPRFSPDGRTIAFTSARGDERRPHLHLMNVDGSNQRQLTQGDWIADGASWSPDGKWIMYETNRADPQRTSRRPWGVWIVTLDGQIHLPLLDHPCWRIFSTDWAP